MAPTSTLPLKGFLSLTARQATTTVVVDSDSDGGGGNNGLDSGAIVGIVLGTIAGILLLWWIIRSCSKPRPARDAPDRRREGWYDEPAPRRSRSRSGSRHYHSSHGHHHRHRSSSRRRSSSRPVVLEEKVAYGVVQPTPVYYAGGASAGRRSRSRSQGRYYAAA